MILVKNEIKTPQTQNLGQLGPNVKQGFFVCLFVLFCFVFVA